MRNAHSHDDSGRSSRLHSPERGEPLYVGINSTLAETDSWHWIMVASKQSLLKVAAVLLLALKWVVARAGDSHHKSRLHHDIRHRGCEGRAL